MYVPVMQVASTGGLPAPLWHVQGTGTGSALLPCACKQLESEYLRMIAEEGDVHMALP